MLVYRTYKYKMRPNKKQRIKLNQIVGSCRYVYNLLLHFNIEQFKRNKKTILVPDMLKLLEVLKDKKPFLKQIPQEILESTIVTLKSDINAQLKNQNKFPSFRIKGVHDTFSLIKDFSINEHTFSIPSVSQIKYHNSRSLENVTTKTLHVYKKGESWFLSLLVSKTIANEKKSFEKVVGIDVGLKEFAILSSGYSIPNPQFYRRLEDKLKKEQKRLARKKYQSNGWHKQKAKVQKVNEDIYHARMNFLHKTSSYIVSNFDVIGIEKLSIQTLVQNKRLSKSILDASWGTFIELLKYKAKEQSKQVIEVGRFYPSTQLCSHCGSKQWMPLHLRIYACKSCGYEIDRDYNASKNIEKKARELSKK